VRYVEWWIACPIVLSDWKVTHSISIQMPAEDGFGGRAWLIVRWIGTGERLSVLGEQ
jgi:hypothetical protein